jgi:acetoin utilization protein AcuB
MHSPVHVVHPHDSVAHAREVCERHRVNQLPVVLDGRLVGIVTDRDLRDAFPSVVEEAERPVRAHRITETLRVEDVMTREPATVGEDQGIDVAATIMRSRRIGALPVVRREEVVGILTRSDLLDALASIV